MRKKDLPSAYENYLENLVGAGILKMDKKASVPNKLPEKLDEKILDFCEKLRTSGFNKQAQEIEENFVSYKGLSSKLEAAIRDNMVADNYEASTQLLGLPESATVWSPIEKQIETARKVLGDPLSKQADFIKQAGLGDDIVEFAVSPLGKVLKTLNSEFNVSDIQSNVDAVVENCVQLISKIPGLNKELSGKLNAVNQIPQTVTAAKSKALSSQSPSPETLKEVQLAVSMLQTASSNVYGLYSGIVNVEKRLAEMDQSASEVKAIKNNCAFLINKLKQNINSVSKVYWSISNSLKPKEQKPVSTNGGIPDFLKRKAAFDSKFKDMTNWLKTMAMSSNQKIVSWANDYAAKYLESLKSGSQNFTDEEQYADRFASFETKVNQAYSVFQKYANMAVARPVRKPAQQVSAGGTGEVANASFNNEDFIKEAQWKAFTSRIPNVPDLLSPVTKQIAKVPTQSAGRLLGRIAPVATVAAIWASVAINLVDIYNDWYNLDNLLVNLDKSIIAMSKIDIPTAQTQLEPLIAELKKVPENLKVAQERAIAGAKTKEGLNLLAASINSFSGASKTVQACWAKIDELNKVNAELTGKDAKLLGEYRDTGMGNPINDAMANLAYTNSKIVEKSQRLASVYNSLKAAYETKLAEENKTNQVDEGVKSKFNNTVDNLIAISKQIEANLNKIYSSNNKELINWVSNKMAPRMSKINKDIDQAEKSSDSDLMNKVIEESNKVNAYLLQAIDNFSIKG